jgi:hypothetical protein
MFMGARTRKQRVGEKTGRVFELPAGARVARRGSTRVEPRMPTERPRSGRGHSLHETESDEG